MDARRRRWLNHLSALNISIIAVGRLRASPERELINDYLDRAGKTGRQNALGPFTVTEVEARNGGAAAEAAKLRAALPPDAVVVALDERGKMLNSPGFCRLLTGFRDDGRRHLACLIGGADGLDSGLVHKADTVLSLGPMVWPHMLARVMLAEQLYRATAISAGLPYHRA